MPKNIDDRISPEPNRRSIRNIPIPEKRRKTDFVDSVAPASRFKADEGELTHKQRRSTDIIPPTPRSSTSLRRSTDVISPEPVYIHKEEDELESLARVEIPKRRFTDRPMKKRRYSKKMIYALFAVLIVGGLAVFSLFSGATITYTPKSTPISFDKDVYTAHKSAQEGDLPFSVIKLSGDKGVEAKASGEEQVSNKASGQIIVYNNASADPQRLIRNTRFETPDGKVYRVQSDITVPGKKDGQPGALEITVYADQPGADYNIDLSDFTLPGLKGDPRFETVYARSKTPMTGGFVGVAKKVSEDDLSKAKSTLESSLRDELLTEAKAQVPDDFVLYPNLIQISYQDLPQTASTGDTATINEHADFYGVMFKRRDLNDFLADKKLQIQPGEVNIQGLESLDISFVSTSTIDLLNTSEIEFELSGNTTAEAIIPEESLKNDLVGQPSDALKEISQTKYPNILSAHGVIRPFWKTSYPDDISKIKVIKSI